MLRILPSSSGIYTVIMLVKYQLKVFTINCLFGQSKKYVQIGRSQRETPRQKEVNLILEITHSNYFTINTTHHLPLNLEIKHRNYFTINTTHHLHLKVIHSLSFCTRQKASQTSNRNVVPFQNDLLFLCTTVEEVNNPEINLFPYHSSQKFVVKILKKRLPCLL